MRWLIYNVLFFIAYLVLLPHFLIRMRRRGGYRAHFRQRFGRYEPDVMERLRERQRVWVHAVSVGESLAAGALLDAMRARDPEMRFVLSTTSSTGYRTCQALVREGDVLIYFPIDFPWAVRRALEAVRPSALVLMESEIWPNMLRQCRRRGVPVILANGRVSDRSFPRYRMGRIIFGPCLRSMRRILVQYELDRARLVAIGANPDSVVVTGTVKFDVHPPKAEVRDRVAGELRGYGFGDGAPVLLGASTWPGEEDALLDAFSALSQRHPEWRLVIVPRHQERGAEVAETIAAHGFPCIRKSQTAAGSQSFPESAVLLADTTGELLAFHSLADVVFVGKSLPPNDGGQNMIEPAALGKAVVVGPATSNFAGVMEIFRASKSIVEIADAEALRPALEPLFADAALRRSLGEAAARTVEANRGALDRTASGLMDCLRPHP